MNIESRKAGYQTLREDLKFNPQISIVIGGGDGTMMWVVEQMLEFQIDINQIIIIPMPFGTGNDFSNSLGWGKSVPHDILGFNYQTLKYFVYQWERGYVCFFDVWDILFKTTKEGYMLEINRTANGYNKQVLKDKDGQNTQIFTKKMSNYCSVGVDARIGYGFDKHRTQSKHINKICYCLEGLKKMFIRTKKINEVVQDLQYENEGQLKTLFKTSNIYEINDGNVIPGNPANLLCLNINSYSAGVQDIWKNAKRNQNIQTYSEGTSFSDGLLEFLSFDSITGMGCERLISGNARRIAQSSGPLVLKFREEPNINLETYFQVDGQFFNVINPLSLEIRPCSQLPNGKIRVLRCQK